MKHINKQTKKFNDILQTRGSQRAGARAVFYSRPKLHKRADKVKQRCLLFVQQRRGLFTDFSIPAFFAFPKTVSVSDNTVPKVIDLIFICPCVVFSLSLSGFFVFLAQYYLVCYYNYARKKKHPSSDLRLRGGDIH